MGSRGGGLTAGAWSQRTAAGRARDRAERQDRGSLCLGAGRENKEPSLALRLDSVTKMGPEN